MPQAEGQLVQVGENPDRPRGEVLGLFPVDPLQIGQVAEDLVDGVAELFEEFRRPARLYLVADGLARHGRRHRAAADADGVDEPVAVGEGLEYLVLADEAPGDDHGRQRFALPFQFVADVDDTLFKHDRREGPFVHHLRGAVAGTAACPVEGDHVDPVLYRHADDPFHVGQVEAGHLEVDVLRTPLPQLGDPLRHGLLGPHREPSVGVEVGAAALFPELHHLGVEGVGVDEVPLLHLFHGLVVVLDPVDRLGPLGTLAELELQGLEAVFFQRYLRNAREMVVDVALEYHLPRSPVIFMEAVIDPLQHGEGRDFAVPYFQFGVLLSRVFANHAGNPCHGSAAEVIDPVHLDHSGQDDGQVELYPVVITVFGSQVDVEYLGMVVIRLDPQGAENTAVNVEMRKIDGVILFRRDLVCACSGRINRYSSQDRRLGDLASARAFLGAQGAHPRLGRNISAPIPGRRKT